MRRRNKSEEGSAVRIVRNSLANGLGSLSGVLITLFLTPLMIDRLGTSGYGVWVLATSLTFSLGYLSFAELGIESSAVRFIAEARGRGDSGDARRAMSTCLALFLGLALVLTPVLVLLAGPIAGLFSMPAEFEDDARLAFMILAAQLMFDLPSRAFSAVSQGAQRYGVWQAVELTQIVTTAVAFAVVLLAGGGLVTLATTSLAIAAFMLLVNVVAARVVARDLRPSPRAVDRGMVRQVFGYGGQLVLFRLGGLVYRQTDKTVIGLVLAASVVTTYEIAFKVQAAASMVESVAVSALLPAVAFHSASRERLQEMFLRGTAYAMALVMPFAVAAFVFADPVIRTWIGEGFDESVGPTRIFLGVLILSSIMSVGQAIMSGLGKLKKMIWFAATWIVVNLTLSLLLVKPLGVEGVILATLISQAVTLIPYIRLFLGELGVSARDFLRRVPAPLVPAVAAQVLASLPLAAVADDVDSLLLVAALSLPGMAAFALVYVFVGLRPGHRTELFGTVRSAFAATRPPEPPAGMREEVPGGEAPPVSGVPQ